MHARKERLQPAGSFSTCVGFFPSCVGCFSVCIQTLSWVPAPLVWVQKIKKKEKKHACETVAYLGWLDFVINIKLGNKARDGFHHSLGIENSDQQVRFDVE